MTLSLARVFGDAGLLWRAQRDLLARIAAVFMFLPEFGLQLFVTPLTLEVNDQEAMLVAFRQWFVDNAAWLVGAKLVETLGATLIFVILFDSARPTLRAALSRAARLAPLAIAVTILTGLALSLGLQLFIIPGLYIAGRTFLAIPALVDEPRPAIVQSLVRAVKLTAGNGWKLFGAIALVWLPILLGWSLLALFAVLGEGSPALKAAVGAVAALIAALGVLAQVLVQAAAYRALAPRQGI